MKPIDSALNFIAPRHCYRCDVEGGVCCQKCLAEIADPYSGKICYNCNSRSLNQSGICKHCFPDQNLDSLFWFADYSDPLASKIVKDLKFNNVFAARQTISEAISLGITKISNPYIITAAPTANKRVRSRGWDQAKLIAKQSARANRINYKSLLIRSSSFDQIGATKLQRSTASTRFFKPVRGASINGKVIILIDDIVTTGSTLNAAAAALKSAGAKEVHAITFARQGLRR